MARRRLCEGCGELDPSDTPNPGVKGFWCEPCGQDREERLENLDRIKTVMTEAGQALSGKDRAAVADYLEGYIDLYGLADQLGTPLVTISMPPPSSPRKATE